MPTRLEQRDEFTHELGPGPDVDEGVSFGFYDPSVRVGGLFRLDNRPGEGVAEVSVCCFLPDGRVGFCGGRPAISGNAGFDAGGLHVDVRRPLEEVSLSWRGELVLLEDPLAVGRPEAVAASPRAPGRVELTFAGVSPAYEGELEQHPEASGPAPGRGRYEQLVHVVGQVHAGDELDLVDGFGIRDHSWGPLAPPPGSPSCRLTGNLGPTFGFSVSRVLGPGSTGRSRGFLWDGTSLMHVAELSLVTGWTGAGRHHDVIEARLVAGDREWLLQGKVIALVPLVEAGGAAERAPLLTQALTRWTLDDGRVGHGFSAYLEPASN
ncbi:MAG: DUF7064 domain-containing protein [Acidimicrobiales bacterium]